MLAFYTVSELSTVVSWRGTSTSCQAHSKPHRKKSEWAQDRNFYPIVSKPVWLIKIHGRCLNICSIKFAEKIYKDLGFCLGQNAHFEKDCMAISWLFSLMYKRSLYRLHMKQLAQWDQMWFGNLFCFELCQTCIYIYGGTHSTLPFSCSKAFDDLSKGQVLPTLVLFFFFP